MEQKLLNGAFLSREVWASLADTTFSDQGTILYSLFSEFYENDGKAASVDHDIIKQQIERKYPKHHKLLLTAIEKFDGTLSIPNLSKEIQEHKKHKVGMRLSSALVDGDVRAINKLLEEYRLLDAETVEEATNPFEHSIDVFHVYDREGLIQVYPKSLNEKVDGGVISGNHILIFARPEMGKSMTAINMACGFVRQGLPGIYFTNEDKAMVILNRVINRLSGMNRYECLENKEEAFKIAMEKGLPNIAVVDMSPGSPKEIEEYILKYKPKWIVVDQIRNLRAGFMGEGGLVHSLEANATSMRNIAKRNDVLVVSVTQAGESATGRATLTMSDVDSSKTGLPAQVDLMIGVGATEEMLKQNQRMLSLCKNKITGDHSYFPVIVDEQLSKVVSF